MIYTGTSGTADAGVDFLAVSGVLTIPTGSRMGIIPLSIVDDLLDEGDETFSVTIGSAVNGSILDSTATVTLVENDVARLSLAKTVTPTLTEPGSSAYVYAGDQQQQPRHGERCCAHGYAARRGKLCRVGGEHLWGGAQRYSDHMERCGDCQHDADLYLCGQPHRRLWRGDHEYGER